MRHRWAKQYQFYAEMVDPVPIAVQHISKVVDCGRMEFEYAKAPPPGHGLQVCEGIHWYCMPLPFALDHVNCWLLGDPDESLLLDTGVDNQATREHWQAAFTATGKWPAEMLVTHFHPDHVGLAGWFAQYGCDAFIGSEIEIDIARLLWRADDKAYAEVYSQWYSAHALPTNAISTVVANGNTYRRKVHQLPLAEHWTYLTEGQNITIAGHEYEVMTGRGHAPDMIMLYRSADHVLIAADQVLPAISPNVSVMPRLKDDNPLDSFLSTLARLQALPDDTLVLPSHGLPFRGLKPRLAALREHHDKRLTQVLDACVSPLSAYELFPILYKRALDAQQLSFALGESLAHLHYLEKQGHLERLELNGVTRFQACSRQP